MKLPEDDPRILVLFRADIATSNEAALQPYFVYMIGGLKYEAP